MGGSCRNVVGHTGWVGHVGVGCFRSCSGGCIM